MRFVPFVLLLSTGFALSGCTSLRWRPDQPPKQTILGAERVELPATFINGFACVDLQINGKGPYRFIVDTGVEGMGVSTRVSGEAGLVFSRKHTFDVHGAGGHRENLPIATVDQIDCPHFSLRGVNVVIMGSEIEDAFAKLGIVNFGGFLGMLPMSDVLLEIDYPRQTVSVAQLASGTPAPEPGIPYWGIVPFVTITTPSTKHATVTAMIDTGSIYGISLNDIASYPTHAGLTKEDNYTMGIGGYWRSLSGQLAGDIGLGSMIWHDPLITDSKVHSLIGGNALTGWKLVIDQKKKMLWLLGDQKITTLTWRGPLEPDGRPAVYGFASIPNGDALIVKEVDPGSRAERAGLKVGDRFTFELPDSSLPVEGAGIHPTRIRLHVVRGDEKLEIVLSLLDPLPAKVTTDAGALEAPADVKRD
jgi:hypothetical protein